MSHLTTENEACAAHLDARSVLIVITAPTSGLDQTSLDADDLRRVGSGLYQAGASNDAVKATLSQVSHLTLKRARTVPPVRGNGTEDASEHVYSLVYYRFESPTPQQKKQTQRLLMRAPCVRLRPGVLLFPHLRKKDVAKYFTTEGKTDLLRAKRLDEELTALGARVTRWSRLKLIGLRSSETVENAIDRMIEHDLRTIELRIRQVKDALSRTDLSNKTLRRRYGEIWTRLKLLKRTYAVIQDVWHHDTERPLRRTYNLLLRLRRAIQNRPNPTGEGATETL
ncbi:MAG: hypothetical protein HXY34_00455 [Candidatus Thorarchaeota archaeon]|nr:hypothetical protein [Candidatus Thorarchaeota archaeon]